jgi:hypothetical protein
VDSYLDTLHKRILAAKVYDSKLKAYNHDR